MSTPRVSIGLPVYNGENYLSDAIESILASEFSGFELIISDNCSTDSTPEICEKYAARDGRIRYSQTETNLGAAPNFNRVWELARGDYFRWAAHDDREDPSFLRKCVEVLDERPEVVLAHSKVRVFDSDWNPVEDYDYRPHTGANAPSRRFSDLLFVRNNCYEVFGLIRANVLRQTGLMGNNPVGDRVLLSELAFRGPFYEIPEYLFFSRDHSDRSVRRLPSQNERAAWFDTRYKGKIVFPEIRTYYEYCKAVRRSPLHGVEKLKIHLCLVQLLRRYRKLIYRDLYLGMRQYYDKITNR
jgi:glycosyltransferase involved in cell wall biosynthesis